MNLKMTIHSTTGRCIVEVFDNLGRFVATIYPDEEINGINIVSKHFDKQWLVEGSPDDLLPPGYRISFNRE